MFRSSVRMLMHITWATKARSRCLPDSLDSKLTTLFQHQATAIGCPWLTAGIAPDHVHILVRLAPTLPLATLVQHLKGASSYTINQQSWLPQPLHWQSCYWAASVDPDDYQGLLAYLARQRIHHDYDEEITPRDESRG